MHSVLSVIPHNVLEAISVARLRICGSRTTGGSLRARVKRALETIRQMNLKRVELHLHLPSVEDEWYDVKTRFAAMEEYTANMVKALREKPVHFDFHLKIETGTTMEHMQREKDAWKTYLARAPEVADIASLQIREAPYPRQEGYRDAILHMMGTIRSPQLRLLAAHIQLLHNAEGVTDLAIEDLRDLPVHPLMNRWTALQFALQMQAAKLTSLRFDNLQEYEDYEAERLLQSAHLTLPMLAYLDLLDGGEEELNAIFAFIGAPNLRVLTVVVSDGSEYVLAPATLDRFPKLQEVKLTLGHLARDPRAQEVWSLV